MAVQLSLPGPPSLLWARSEWCQSLIVPNFPHLSLAAHRDRNCGFKQWEMVGTGSKKVMGKDLWALECLSAISISSALCSNTFGMTTGEAGFKPSDKWMHPDGKAPPCTVLPPWESHLMVNWRQIPPPNLSVLQCLTVPTPTHGYMSLGGLLDHLLPMVPSGQA